MFDRAQFPVQSTFHRLDRERPGHVVALPPSLDGSSGVGIELPFKTGVFDVPNALAQFATRIVIIDERKQRNSAKVHR